MSQNSSSGFRFAVTALAFLLFGSVFFPLRAHAREWADNQNPQRNNEDLRETGLEGGNTLTHATLSGHVSITCTSYFVRPSVEFDCAKDLLLPVEYARFQTAEAVDADHFDLSVAHQQSWSRYKSGDYISTAGTSSLALNLWDSNLFNLPILDDGLNYANYTLTKNGHTVAQGEFQVLGQTGDANLPDGHGGFA